MASSAKFGTVPSEVLVVATGGVARERAEYVDGERTGESVMRGGAAVRRLTGMAVSVGGLGLDGAVVDTTTPLDEVEAGTIYRAEGEVEVGVRAEAKPGFKAGDKPRADLAFAVFIERLVPVGSAMDLLRKGGGTAPVAAGAQSKDGESK